MQLQPFQLEVGDGAQLETILQLEFIYMENMDFAILSVQIMGLVSFLPISCIQIF